jgi:hypothetical protein
MMSTDTRAFLPQHIRVNDVAKVLGGLAGSTVHRHDFDNSAGYAAWCDDARVTTTSMPEMLSIDITANGEVIHFDYFFEADGGVGERELIARHCDRNVNLLTGLVRFFGGRLDANDCDDVDVDLAVAVHDATWPFPYTPSAGDEWYRFQDAVLAVKPVLVAV